MTDKLTGGGSEMPRGVTQPRCINCTWFKKAFVDDHTFSINPERIYDGMCALEPLWQAVSRGNEHYCSHHKPPTPGQPR